MFPPLMHPPSVILRSMFDNALCVLEVKKSNYSPMNKRPKMPYAA